MGSRGGSADGSVYAGNRWKFYLYKGMSGFSTIGPILVLFMLAKPMTLAQFMVLMGIMNVTITLFEIPTGVVADKVSRKLSLTVGVALGFFAMLIGLFAVRFWILAIAFFIWGVGETFFSGADTALLYDSLKADHREEEAHGVMGVAASILAATGVAGALACSGLVRLGGLSAPFAVGVCSIAARLVPVLLFKEPVVPGRSGTEARRQSAAAVVREYWAHLRESFRIIGRSRQVFLLVLVSLCVDRLLFLYQRPFMQPSLIGVGFEPSQLGLLYAALGAVTAVLSRVSRRFASLLGDRESRTFPVILSLAAGTLVLYAMARTPVTLVAAVVLFRVVGGLHVPAIQVSLNRRLPSEQRAACLSVASAGNHLLGFMLGPLYGHVADAYSLGTGLLVFLASFGPLLLAAAVASAVVLRRPAGTETPPQGE